MPPLGAKIAPPRTYVGVDLMVEPLDGHELDRLITALLNVTGVIHRVIETTEHPPDSDGVVVIGLAADRLRGILGLEAEHTSDEDLAFVTQFLAETTLLVASHLGLDGCFAGD